MGDHDELFEHLYGCGEHRECLKKIADAANARSRARRNASGPNEQSRLFQRAQEKLFDALFPDGTGVEYGTALKKIADTANNRTRELREARDDSFKVCARLSDAFDVAWKDEWRKARDRMILEVNDE
jgi:hypothetical protein